MRTMATSPVAAEIGRTAVELIQIMRARGRTATQVADDLELDVYVVDEVFAWHDWLCRIDSCVTLSLSVASNANARYP